MLVECTGWATPATSGRSAVVFCWAKFQGFCYCLGEMQRKGCIQELQRENVLAAQRSCRSCPGRSCIFARFRHIQHRLAQCSSVELPCSDEMLLLTLVLMWLFPKFSNEMQWTHQLNGQGKAKTVWRIILAAVLSILSPCQSWAGSLATG